MGPILQALTGYTSSSRGKIDKSPDSGSIPGDQSAFTTLLNTFVRVYPLPVGPDGIMEPASQGSWGLGENAQVLTTGPGTNVTLNPATLLGNKTSPSKELVPKDSGGDLPRMDPRQEILPYPETRRNHRHVEDLGLQQVASQRRLGMASLAGWGGQGSLAICQPLGPALARN